jgi:hypothetical protein
MKAERKELERNLIVEKLREAYAGFRQGPSRGTLVWVGVIAVVLLVYAAWRYFSASSATVNSGRWKELDEAVFPQQLEGLVDKADYKSTTPGRVAQFKEARRLLRDGLTRLGGSAHADAVEQVEKATEMYEGLAKETGPLPLLHQEALMGAARGNESLGKLDQARELYGQLASKYPDTELGKDAQKQRERLDDKANAEDLDKLGKRYGPKGGKGE